VYFNMCIVIRVLKYSQSSCTKTHAMQYWQIFLFDSLFGIIKTWSQTDNVIKEQKITINCLQRYPIENGISLIRRVRFTWRSTRSKQKPTTNGYNVFWRFAMNYLANTSRRGKFSLTIYQANSFWANIITFRGLFRDACMVSRL